MAQQEEDVLAFDPKDTITGFNYGFCKNLLTQVQRIELTGKLYEEDSGSNDSVLLTGLGAICLNQLRKQLYGDDEGFVPGTRIELAEIQELLSAAHEFLALMRAEA